MKTITAKVEALTVSIAMILTSVSFILGVTAHMLIVG